MPFDKFAAVNWLAVLVAALAIFFCGALWYTVLWGKLWQRLHGFTPERAAEMQKKLSPPLFLGAMLVCYSVAAALLALLIVALDLRAAGPGASLAVVVATCTAAVLFTNHLALLRHPGLFLIDAGFVVVSFPIAGAILGAWR